MLFGAAAAFFAFALSASPASGSWGTYGNQAAIAVKNQVNAQAISDGAGGMIVTWQDFRTDTADIYAQRFDASGNRLWGDLGVAICAFADHQESPLLCSDGAGGAIIAWQDRRNVFYDIFAQAVDADGALKWTPGTGVSICGASSSQIIESIASDGAGGAIIAWRDSRGSTTDIYARRVNSSGTPLWTADGVGVCTFSGFQASARVVPDQLGGAYVVWRDPRNGGQNNDIFAQSLDADGNPRWAANGVAVCSEVADQIEPSIAGDGHFGLLVTWQDFRNGTDYNVFAQRMKPDGTPRWTPNGVAVSTAPVAQQMPLIVPDGLSGAIIAWTDSRNSPRPDVFAQRLDSLGVRAWLPSDGIAVAATDSSQFIRTLIPDGLGGAIVGWDDDRAGHFDVFAQSVSPTGSIRWSPAGLLIGTGSNSRHVTTSAPDGYAGALFAWEDFRGGPNCDIFGLRVTSLGTGVEATPAPRVPALLFPAHPNPFNPHTRLEFVLESPAHYKLTIHDVHGRLVRVLAEGDAPAGRHGARWDGLDGRGRACGSGVYFAKLALPSGHRSTSLVLAR